MELTMVSHSFWKEVAQLGNQYRIEVARQDILVARQNKCKDT